VTPTGFGRIASQYAKQALMQKIRQAEKAMLFTEFKDRVGDIVSGTVRRFDRSDVILDLGKYEALLPNKERVPTEEYQVGERIRCYVKAVRGRTARAGNHSVPRRPAVHHQAVPTGSVRNQRRHD
jgi:transcription termination/antitermination protein NusA